MEQSGGFAAFLAKAKKHSRIVTYTLVAFHFIALFLVINARLLINPYSGSDQFVAMFTFVPWILGAITVWGSAIATRKYCFSAYKSSHLALFDHLGRAQIIILYGFAIGVSRPFLYINFTFHNF